MWDLKDLETRLNGNWLFWVMEYDNKIIGFGAQQWWEGKLNNNKNKGFKEKRGRGREKGRERVKGRREERRERKENIARRLGKREG